MLFVGCWWQIPISEPSAFNPACLSVASDRPDELWCPVLFCNPLEPVCLQPPPLYTHAQTNKDTSSLILGAQKQHLFSFSVSLSHMHIVVGDWPSSRTSTYSFDCWRWVYARVLFYGNSKYQLNFFNFAAWACISQLKGNSTSLTD